MGVKRGVILAALILAAGLMAPRPAQADCVEGCTYDGVCLDCCANLCDWFGGSPANNNVDCSSPGHATNPACGRHDDSGCEPGTYLAKKCWQECGYNCWEECYSCFPAGTKVTMADGSRKNIEKIEAGETVISQTETGETTESRVAEIETPIRDHLCRIEFADGSYLEATDEHPLRAKDGASTAGLCLV